MSVMNWKRHDQHSETYEAAPERARFRLSMNVTCYFVCKLCFFLAMKAIQIFVSKFNGDDEHAPMHGSASWAGAHNLGSPGVLPVRKILGASCRPFKKIIYSRRSVV